MPRRLKSDIELLRVRAEAVDALVADILPMIERVLRKRLDFALEAIQDAVKEKGPNQ